MILVVVRSILGLSILNLGELEGSQTNCLGFLESLQRLERQSAYWRISGFDQHEYTANDQIRPQSSNRNRVPFKF